MALLFKCLKSFNFGYNFCKWVKIFYNDISSCVGNNGHYSEYFKLSRSVRQGCPISALLFILGAEMLAIKIRKDSLEIAINIFEQFRQCSILKLNLNITEIIPIVTAYKKVH